MSTGRGLVLRGASCQWWGCRNPKCGRVAASVWLGRSRLWLVVGVLFFFFQAEDGIRDVAVTGVQTCALPISPQLKRDPLGTSREPSLISPRCRVRALAPPGRSTSRYRVDPPSPCYRGSAVCGHGACGYECARVFPRPRSYVHPY